MLSLCVSVRAFSYLTFPMILWKNNNSKDFKYMKHDVFTNSVTRKDRFNFGPVGDRKMRDYWVSEINERKYVSKRILLIGDIFLIFCFCFYS